MRWAGARPATRRYLVSLLGGVWGWEADGGYMNWRFRIGYMHGRFQSAFSNGGFKNRWNLEIQQKPSRLSTVEQNRGAAKAGRRRLAVVVGATPACRRRVGSLRAVVLEVAIHARGVARVREDLVDRMRCQQAAGKRISSVGVAAVAASLSLALLRTVPRPRVAPCDQSWDCALRSAEMGGAWCSEGLD